ncbi:unnamed protein product [Amoebophrya sp. A120]|nr:unnamed protein product [Amoebophrya sp. A120]|eukprot:GSA120T00000712001.1
MDPKFGAHRNNSQHFAKLLLRPFLMESDVNSHSLESGRNFISGNSPNSKRSASDHKDKHEGQLLKTLKDDLNDKVHALLRLMVIYNKSRGTGSGSSVFANAGQALRVLEEEYNQACTKLMNYKLRDASDGCSTDETTRAEAARVAELNSVEQAGGWAAHGRTLMSRFVRNALRGFRAP